jgi:DNA (cytosine-5)-methyltransferase 1
VALLPTPTARDGDGRGEGSPEWWAERLASGKQETGLPLGAAVNAYLPAPTASEGAPNFRTDSTQLLPTPRATDGTKGGPNQRGSSGDLMLPSAVMDLLPTPVAKDVDGVRNATANRTDPKPTTATTGWTLSDVVYADRWGRYAPAIQRWEQIIGRPAPEPTEPNRNGQPRLAPRFVEWLMGYPEGWVTDVITTRQSLRPLGNSVCPQQCAAVLPILFAAHFGQPLEVAA